MTPKQLREARKAAGLTQAALAAQLGVHKISVTRWETGVYPISPVAALAVEMICGAHLDTQAKIVARRARTGSAAAKRPRKSLRTRG